MRIVFFGTSEFAVPPLAKLSQSHKIVAVVTKSDKPRGRHLIASPSPVKSKAKELNLPLIFIEEAVRTGIADELRRCKADLFIVVAYGEILPAEILNIPKFYSIGLHASLLPEYRGAAPINWAMLNGDKESGITVFRLNEKMDAGDIILQKAEEILDSDNAQTLSLKLSCLGAGLLLESIRLIEEGKGKFIKQKEEEATFAPKLKKRDGIVDWTKTAMQIHNQVRAMHNWPGAFSNLGGRTIKIWETDVAEPQSAGAHKPGEVIKAEPSGILVGCGKGNLWIRQLQAEGGKRMRVCDYLLGHKISAGDFLL